MNLIELKEKRARLISNAKLIIDGVEGAELTPEQQEQFDALTAEAEQIEQEIQTEENSQRKSYIEEKYKNINVAVRKASPAINRNYEKATQEEANLALRTWCLQGRKSSSEAFRICDKLGIDPTSTVLDLRAIAASAGSGVNIVPRSMLSSIEENLRFFNPLRNFATVLTTEKGDDLDIPRVDDTNNGVQVAEGNPMAINVDPTFSKITLKSWLYSSNIVQVSEQLLTDSQVDIATMLGRLLAIRVSRFQSAQMWTTGGAGTTTPQSLSNAAGTAAVNLPSGNAITIDNVIDLVHSVDPAYWANSAFSMHPATASALRKVKASTAGTYLWEPAVQAGQPDRLLGYPVVLSTDITPISTPGDNQPLIYFGDHSKYYIRDVGGSMTVKRLNELYVAANQVGFVLTLRSDGRFAGFSNCLKSLNSFDTP
jgi:HK97 family phage major capsid protein